MLVAAAAVVLALTAACISSGECSGTPAGRSPAAERLTLRVPASIHSGGYPTPYASRPGPGRPMTTYVFDTLAFPDVTGEPKAWLARTWTSSPDGRTWTFSLNEHATFHDGKPLTSADVVFTFDYNLIGSGASTGVAQGVTYIDTVTAPEPKTVVIRLKSARPSFLQDIAGAFGFPIMPKHIWEGVTEPGDVPEPHLARRVRPLQARALRPERQQLHLRGL